MKYQTIREALETPQGEKLYTLISKGMDRGFDLTAERIKKSIYAFPCYLGSEDHIGRMVWMIMNANE
jgi:hypothetical protein